MSQQPPIVCKGIDEERPAFTESGGRVGYMRSRPASKLTIRLKAGRVEHKVDQQNRVVAESHEGVHVSFSPSGVLEVTEAQWTSAGMSREECVAFLREGADKGRYEVVGEDSPRDARKPIPAGAGKQ